MRDHLALNASRLDGYKQVRNEIVKIVQSQWKWAAVDDALGACRWRWALWPRATC